MYKLFTPLGHTSSTPVPEDMADSNLCLGSVFFCSTNVVPCTIYYSIKKRKV